MTPPPMATLRRALARWALLAWPLVGSLGCGGPAALSAASGVVVAVPPASLAPSPPPDDVRPAPQPSATPAATLSAPPPAAVGQTVARSIARLCASGCGPEDMYTVWRDGGAVPRRIEIATSGPGCPPFGRRTLYDADGNDPALFLDYATPDEAARSLALERIQGLTPDAPRKCSAPPAP